MNFFPENLPLELKAKGRFCLWRYEERGGKLTKPPYNPHTGRYGDSSDPDAFASFDEVLGMAVFGGFDGIGLGVFGRFCAIDVDHCVNADGTLSPLAQDIVDTMDTYTELSPSGQGVRILFYADHVKYDTGTYYVKNPENGVEVYVAGVSNRYVTVTGNTIRPAGMCERSAQLQIVLDRYMLRKQSATSTASTTGASILTDEDVLKKATTAANGEKFAALWRGDITGVSSHSEADLALCNMLAFWTRRDADQVDRLFRQSGLMRPKWDRKQSGTTYGALTVQKAITSCAEVYSPPAKCSAEVFAGVQGQQVIPRRADGIQEKAVEWVIRGLIPRKCQCLNAAEGGTGKGFIACAIAAAVSNGDAPREEHAPFVSEVTENKRVLIISSEDSASHVLRPRLRALGANLENVYIVTADDEGFETIKTDSAVLEQLISDIRPAIVILDPLQSFISPTCRMSERNAMRQALTPLRRLCEKYDTAFLILMHTNKRAGAWGRNRLSDSSDIWDYSRSVMVAGVTGDGDLKYLSQEKCNLAPLSDTILFSIDGGRFTFRGTTMKKDRDFVASFLENVKGTPAKDSAVEFIREYLKDDEKEIRELESAAKANSISSHTLRRAKEELRKDGTLRVYSKGNNGKGRGTKWFCRLTN